MDTNLISLLIGCGVIAIIIAILLVSICKHKKSNKIAKSFLEGLSDELLSSIIDVIKKVPAKEYKTYDEFELAILTNIYEDTWEYTKNKLEAELGAENITAKIVKSIDQDKLIKFIDGLIEKENINTLIMNTYGSFKIENDDSEKQDKELEEKYSDESQYVETLDTDSLPSSEEEVHTEEEINNLNPQRDEEEKFDIEDDSMEVVVDKPEIISKLDKNGNTLYYEVSSDGKKKRVTKEYALANMK